MSRLPTEVQSARMGRLSRLPAFFALAGKRAVVAGGGQAAVWKAELLSAAGAAVDVFSSKAGEDMRALTAAPPGGHVAIHERAWSADDLSGAAIAVGDCADDEEAARIRRRRARRGGAGERDRPAGVLRFLPSAPSSTVRRSSSEFRPTAPRRGFGQAIRAKTRSADPEWLCALGGGGAQAWRLARAGARAARSAAGAMLWEQFAERAVAAPDQRARPKWTWPRC